MKKIYIVLIVIAVVVILLLFRNRRPLLDNELSGVDMSAAKNYIKFGTLDVPVPAPNKFPTPPTPKIKESVGEKECRRVLENYYGKPFIRTRSLSFLKNPETGRLLELDGYNDELKIAFEFNGKQHYDWPNHTNQTLDQFIQQKRRDLFKRKQCEQNGVYLITVPYTETNIADFVHKHLPNEYPQTPRNIADMVTEENTI